MSKYMTIYRKEYLSGTRTFSCAIDECDLQRINDDLKEYATPATEGETIPQITFQDLSNIWNSDHSDERLEQKIRVRYEWGNHELYEIDLWTYIADYLNDWVYADDEYEDDLEYDGWNSEDWSDDTTFEDQTVKEEK